MNNYYTYILDFLLGRTPKTINNQPSKPPTKVAIDSTRNRNSTHHPTKPDLRYDGRSPPSALLHPLPVPTFMPIVRSTSVPANAQALAQFLASLAGFAFILAL